MKKTEITENEQKTENTTPRKTCLTYIHETLAENKRDVKN